MFISPILIKDHGNNQFSSACEGWKYLLINAKVGVPKGLWNNPGGHKDEDETLEECAKREAKEETGYNVEIGRLIGTFTYKETTKSVYEAKIFGDELSLPEDEIGKAGLFSLEEIKNLQNITFGTMQFSIDFSDNKFNQ